MYVFMLQREEKLLSAVAELTPIVKATVVSSGNTQELVQVERTLRAERRTNLGHAHEENSS